MAYKSKQFFFGLVKITIVIGAIGVICHKLFYSENLSWLTFKTTILNSDILKLTSIGALIVLSLINWILEILKWHKLVSAIEHISFYKSFTQSVSSLAVSLLTPNRIGEYGAKALFFKREQRPLILSRNFLGNSCQLLVTLCFGCIGLVYLIKNYSYKFQLSLYQTSGIILVIGLFLIIMFWLFKKKKQNFNLSIFNKNLILKTLGFSVLRYVVFSFQFYVLLRFFNLEISYFLALAFISSFYFISSIIPTLSLFDVVVKSSVAISVFGLLGFNPLIILSITLIMWLFNFAIPALIGCYYVLIFKSTPKSV